MNQSAGAPKRKRAIWKYLLPVAVLLLLAMHGTGILEGVLTSLYKGKIDQANEKYLEEATIRSTESLLVLSGVKAAVGMLESSSAGFSFGANVEIQLGRVLQATSQTVDTAWKANQTGLIAYLVINIIFKTATFLARPVMWLLLLAALAWSTVNLGFARLALPRRLLLKSIELLLVFAAVIYLLLPLSVYGASRLSRHIVHPGYKKSVEHFRQTHQKLEPLKVQVVDKIRSSGTPPKSVESPPPAKPKEVEPPEPTPAPPEPIPEPPKPEKKESLIKRIEDGLKGAAIKGEHEVSDTVKEGEHLIVKGVKGGEHLVEKPFVFLKHKWDEIHGLFKEVDQVLHTKIEHLHEAAHRMFAAILFESFIFPLGLLWLTCAMTRSVISHLFGQVEFDHFRHNMVKDLDPRQAAHALQTKVQGLASTVVALPRDVAGDASSELNEVKKDLKGAEQQLESKARQAVSGAEKAPQALVDEVNQKLKADTDSVVGPNQPDKKS